MTDEDKQQKLSDKSIVRAVDDIFRAGGHGTRSSIYLESARGFNIHTKGQMVKPSRSSHAKTFFTRPDLNLTYDNLNKDDKFLVYRDAPEYSIARMCRVFLDPRNQRDHVDNPIVKSENVYLGNDGQRGLVSSPLVDINSPFIPYLSNRLLSLSGWPDTRLDYYASDKGLRNEQWIMADGISEINESYSLDCTFQNDEGDGVYMLANLWVKYQSALLDTIDPYPIKMALREIDYMTRIYHFVMDETDTYITHWAICGAGFPTNISDGSVFQYNSDSPSNDALDNVSIQFQCVGARYNDPIYLVLFNKLVGTFNTQLRLTYDKSGYSDDLRDTIPEGNKYGNINWIKLEHGERLALNYCAYPLINMVTKELEWWVKKSDYFNRYVKQADFMPANKGHERLNIPQQFRGGVVSSNHTPGKHETTERPFDKKDVHEQSDFHPPVKRKTRSRRNQRQHR